MGLKSLNERLSALEGGSKVFEPSFVSYAHKKNEEEQEKQRTGKYNEIIEVYQNEVKKYIDEPLKQFTRLAELTVHFVEKYIPIICELFKFTISSDVKLNFAIELIKIVVDLVAAMLDSDFVKNTINHFVMIMNERKKEYVDNKPVKRKKKSFFKSIRSVSLR